MRGDTVYVILVDVIVLFMELESVLSEYFQYTCRLLYVVLIDGIVLFRELESALSYCRSGNIRN